MQFKLLFDEQTFEKGYLSFAAESSAFQFPPEEFTHTQNEHLSISCTHYQSQNIHFDHYLVDNSASEYQVGIATASEVYSFIMVKKGSMMYSDKKKFIKLLQISENECCLLRASKGIYYVRFLHTHSDYQVISMSTEIINEFTEDFDELIEFMEAMVEPGLFFMPISEMDYIFTSKLERIQSFLSFLHKKHKNRRMLWEIPELLSAYKGLLRKKDKPSMDRKLGQKIDDFIQLKVQQREPINVEILCLEFPISRKKLERLFSQYFGQSPARYIRQIKMQQVGLLLKTTNISFLEIALSFGYSDVNALNKAFKKQMRITLWQYRHGKPSK